MPEVQPLEHGLKGPVLLVGNFFSPSVGAHNPSVDLADRLRKARWEVLTTSDRLSRPARLGDMLWTVYRNRHAFKAANVDVFSGPAFVWAECVCGVLDRLGIPYTITLHGGRLDKFADRWPRRVRRVLSNATKVTVPSGYLFDAMAKLRSDIVLLPNPIDVSSYRYRQRSDPEPRLVWMRAFHRTYNPALALRVLVRLRERFPGATLDMIGPDKGDGSLEETRRTAGRFDLGDSVRFVGPLRKAEVADALQRGDIFLNTTNVDNTPVSVIEAMACGLPIVSTNVGGIPYLLDEGREALLVPPDDPGAMAEAVGRILEEPSLSARLSEAGRKKAEEFDWPSIFRRWEDLLESIASESSG